MNTLLQAGARQATNYKIGADFQALLTWHREGRALEGPRVFLSEITLLHLSPTDVRYRTLQALLAMRARHDIRTGQALRPQAVEDHHIYPASLRRSHGVPRRRLDSICNRMFVSSDTNRHLSDRLPEDYMGELASEAKRQNIEHRMDQRLADAAVPGSVSEPGFAARFAIGRIEGFMTERARVILDRVRDVIGDSLVVGSPAVEDDDGPPDLAEDE